MTPTIACVVTTHRRPELLARALRSIARQSLQPDEVVVVSDCEDPEAERTCRVVADETDLDVRFLQRQHGQQGPSGSRNHGVANTSSAIVALLDDDDLWAPRYLESARDLLSARECEMVVTWISVVSATSSAPGASIAEGLTPRQVVAMNRGSTGSNMVLTRESFDDVGGFDDDLRVKNDTDFFFRYLKAGHSYAVVKERLVDQIKHQNGQLTGHTEMRARGNEIYMRKHRDDLQLAQRREIRMWIHYIRFRTATKWPARAGHALAAAFNVSPVKVIHLGRFRRMERLAAVPGFDE